MTSKEPGGTGTAVLLRGGVSAVVGVAAGVAVAAALGFAAGLLAGWTAFAATSLVWILLVVWRMDAAETKAHATTEDPGRNIARVISLLGSVASLGAVAVVLVEARNRGEFEAFLLAGIAVLSVAASWALIQLHYMLRIAAVYYADPVGGIDFNQAEDPEYTDFAYFAIGLGMTYQVADTNVQTNEMRRIIIAQTLLAYLFGAVILATVINLVTSLG